MGLFSPKEPNYDLSVRQTGFNRYRQLLSLYGWNWFKIGLMTVGGALPLAVGIAIAILSSSTLVLIPVSIIGGMIFGPFLAGMYDAVMRGLRDDPNNWWTNYKKSWRQNWKSSLLPGALLGLMLGMFAFMAYLFWISTVAPSAGTIALALFALLLLTIINTLYWPQLVLFEQTTVNRMRNIILFTSKYLWRVLGVALLQLVYYALIILFAPWTLIVIPLLGVWYIIFLSEFILYERLDKELHIEEQYNAANGQDKPEEFEEEAD